MFAFGDQDTSNEVPWNRPTQSLTWNEEEEKRGTESNNNEGNLSQTILI